jgi:arylsulfatase A-like enzyme
MWAPGRIPAGTECDQLATTLDLLPTIAALTDSELPKDRKIDGVDISSLLADPTAESPRKEFLYYHKRGYVEGIRQGDWKLLKKNERTKKGEPIVERILLFDLSKDIGEQQNMAKDKPGRVKAMRQRMIELDAEVEQNARAVWSQ